MATIVPFEIDKKNIDKKDIAFGFFLIGQRPGKVEGAWLTGLFSSYASIPEAIRGVDVMFKNDPEITRVIMEGKKTHKKYVVFHKNIDGVIVPEILESGGIVNSLKESLNKKYSFKDLFKG